MVLDWKDVYLTWYLADGRTGSFTGHGYKLLHWPMRTQNTLSDRLDINSKARMHEDHPQVFKFFFRGEQQRVNSIDYRSFQLFDMQN